MNISNSRSTGHILFLVIASHFAASYMVIQTESGGGGNWLVNDHA